MKSRHQSDAKFISPRCGQNKKIMTCPWPVTSPTFGAVPGIPTGRGVSAPLPCNLASNGTRSALRMWEPRITASFQKNSAGIERRIV
jgi:hypothetical protein